MAITIQTASGKTLYAVIRNPANLLWNGAAFAVFAAGAWASYKVPMSEQGATGFYWAAFPAGVTAPGRYTVVVCEGAGVVSDAVMGASELVWDGAAEVVTSTSAQNAEATVAAILVTPANKLATNADGKVTLATPPPTANAIATAVVGTDTVQRISGSVGAFGGIQTVATNGTVTQVMIVPNGGTITRTSTGTTLTVTRQEPTTP